MGLVHDCPLREDVSVLEEALKELARRVTYLDGNGIDKGGGQVGRLTAISVTQTKLLGKWERMFWIGLGATGALGAGNILFLREILHALPK